MRFIIVLIILLVRFNCHATDYSTDATPTVVEVQALHDSATIGDRIIFGGDATWSGAVTITKPLTIDGNNHTLTGSGSINGFFVLSNITSDTLIRITGFTFDVSAIAPNYVIGFSGLTLGSLRVDHNTFNFGSSGYFMDISGCKGVFDHNTVYNNANPLYYSAGTRAQADAAWTDLEMGTENAFFIENNTFIQNTATQSQEIIGTFNGGKLVIRYNEFDFDDANPPPASNAVIMTHGSAPLGVDYWQQGSDARRGQTTTELYENNAHGYDIDYFATLRGSANLVYNNTAVSASGTPGIFLLEEEFTEGYGWEPIRTEWPGEDQVHNTFIWGNTTNGNALTISHVSATAVAIVQDRDFFMHAPQATGGKEAFTGLNGASNTHPTDGDPYPTEGTMTFSASGPNAYYGYAPYTYPHPLIPPSWKMRGSAIHGVVR